MAKHKPSSSKSKAAATAELATTLEITHPKRATEHQAKQAQLTDIAQTRLEKYYNKIVAGFLSVSAVLILLIIYFSFSHTTVTVTPNLTQKDITITTTVQDVSGVLLLSDVTADATYTAFTGTTSEDGTASGTVTIVNNTNADQPLVATTRLLSKADNEADRILFRTQDSIVVPAQGSTDVVVVADQPGASGDIGASEFEIVALSSSLKVDIYGKSTNPMTGGVVKTATVAETDITAAKQLTVTALQTKAQDLFAKELQTRTDLPELAQLVGTPTLVKLTDETVDRAVGDETDALHVTQTATMAIPVVNSAALLAQVQKQINQQLTAGTQPTTAITADDLTVSVESISEDQANATLSISVPLTVTIDEHSAVIDPRNLTNKTESELQSYLLSFPEIQTVTVDIAPFWSHKTPYNASNITVKMNGVTSQ